MQSILGFQTTATEQISALRSLAEMNISPPSHPDYRLQCEESIDAVVREMVDIFILAGWAPAAVHEALQSVVDSQRLAYEKDPYPADDPIKPLDQISSGRSFGTESLDQN